MNGDPSVLDHDPPHLDGLDPSQVPDQPFGDPMLMIVVISISTSLPTSTPSWMHLQEIVGHTQKSLPRITSKSTVFTANLHQSSPQEPDWNALRPFFAWTSPSSIKDTFNVTTRHGTAPHIQDYQSEPYHQHQNMAENHFYLPSFTPTLS